MKCPKRGKIGRPIPTSEDKPLHPTSINPFRKSVYGNASRHNNEKRPGGDVFGEKEESEDKFEEAHEELKARGLVEE